ncbi:MAG: ABC transporter permease subunit [Ignavibacteria bacterium]|nr:ABC transporter permease subunit [Ignavibacteria bacterium]
MNTALKIFKYVLYDVLRSKMIIIYTLLLLIISFGIIFIGKDVTKAVLSLLNIVLLVVPLVSIIFGTIHFYSSREFMEMLLAMPVKRKNIFWAEYAGLSLALAAGFSVGTGLPLLIYGGISGAFQLIVSGVMLTFIFTALAFLSSVKNKDKARGIGLSLVIWFYLSVIFDALVLLLYYLFSSYPLEKATIIISGLNPVDLARMLILLQLDVSALMGYTGATLQKFFGSDYGMVFSVILLLFWAIVPTVLSLRIFNRKDF